MGNYWLLKSEPDEFSIADLETRKTEPWTGVRNYLARNHLRAMDLGDQFFFYHSSCAVPGIAGIGKIAQVAVADITQFDPESDYFDAKSSLLAPRWSSVLTEFVAAAAPLISLDQLRMQAEALGDFALLNRGNRLSVLPVSASQWQHIIGLSDWRSKAKSPSKRQAAGAKTP
jgi:predicted RNA-binding protein with PUA-like domain